MERMKEMKNFGYVLATRKLVEEKLPVRFMYREHGAKGDSGWRFFAGVEDQEYVDNPENIKIYDIQTILDIDKSIAPYLDAAFGSAFERENITGPFVLDENFGFAAEDSEVQ